MGGCDYWCWVDPPPSPFLQEVLVDVRDAMRALKRENIELKGRVGDAAGQQKSPVVDAIKAHMVALVTKKE